MSETEILEMAAARGLPEIIEDDSLAPIQAFKELVDAGFLTGEPILCDSVVDAYQFLEITHVLAPA